jgi:uncharacterized membrane protein (DUF2068 family)
MDAGRHTGTSRALAALHALLAVLALGLGNATLDAPGDVPALTHLAFGLVLAVTAWGLWRRSAWTRWAIAVNVAVSLIVALTLLASLFSGNGGVPLLFTLVAVAFAGVELASFRHASGFAGR